MTINLSRRHLAAVLGDAAVMASPLAARARPLSRAALGQNRLTVSIISLLIPQQSREQTFEIRWSGPARDMKTGITYTWEPRTGRAEVLRI